MAVRYSEEFKKNAIDMHLSGLGFNEIGRQLSIHPGTVSGWCKSKASEVDVNEDNVYEQLRAANLEIRRLKEDRDILEKALLCAVAHSAFFAAKKRP